jgi:DNA-binding MarR family transcriptional regulator
METGFQFLKVAAQLNARLAQSVKYLGVTPQQLKLLFVMYESPKHQCTVNTLKSAMVDPNSNVSRMLNKMEEKGLVKRVPDEVDGRVVYLRIQKSGVQVMCEGKEKMDAVMTRFNRISNVQQEHFIEILSIIELDDHSS